MGSKGDQQTGLGDRAGGAAAAYPAYGVADKANRILDRIVGAANLLSVQPQHDGQPDPVHHFPLVLGNTCMCPTVGDTYNNNKHDMCIRLSWETDRKEQQGGREGVPPHQAGAAALYNLRTGSFV